MNVTKKWNEEKIKTSTGEGGLNRWSLQIAIHFAEKVFVNDKILKPFVTSIQSLFNLTKSKMLDYIWFRVFIFIDRELQKLLTFQSQMHFISELSLKIILSECFIVWLLTYVWRHVALTALSR